MTKEVKSAAPVFFPSKENSAAFQGALNGPNINIHSLSPANLQAGLNNVPPNATSPAVPATAPNGQKLLTAKPRDGR